MLHICIIYAYIHSRSEAKLETYINMMYVGLIRGIYVIVFFLSAMMKL